METTPQTIEACYAQAVAAFPQATFWKVEYGVENNSRMWWVCVRIEGEMIGRHGLTFEAAAEKLRTACAEALAELARACPICGGKNYDEYAHTHPCKHEWTGHTDPGTVNGPPEYHSFCKHCGAENPGSCDADCLKTV